MSEERSNTNVIATESTVHVSRSDRTVVGPSIVDRGPSSGETDERLFTVAARRDAPYFTEAERAALALTEAITRLSDRADPVRGEWAKSAHAGEWVAGYHETRA